METEGFSSRDGSSLIRTLPGHFPLDVFQACPSRRRPQDNPRTCWRDKISSLTWEHLGISKEELERFIEEGGGGCP